jgi:hypothetical protein
MQHIEYVPVETSQQAIESGLLQVISNESLLDYEIYRSPNSSQFTACYTAFYGRYRPR